MGKHNIKLQGEKGADPTLDCLEAWATRRGISMIAAARILITKSLDSERIGLDLDARNQASVKGAGK